ncbi:MAG: hypothetical protein GWP91_08755 [Rhodobacterales bacterium]|nr:hypothetical protein [Rhodobacterales bacterium]
MKGLVLAVMLAISGCAKGGLFTPTPASSLTTLERLRARPAPEQMRAKMAVKISSRPFNLAQSAPAVMIADLPTRAHVALMGPLGGPAALLTANGDGLTIGLPRDRHVMQAPEADSALRKATQGLLGVPELLSLLVGRLPLDDAHVRRRQPLDDDRELVILIGPAKTQITVMLDVVRATPIAMVVKDKTGRDLFRAAFEPFELDAEDRWLPTALEIDVMSMELHVHVRYKSWKDLDTLPDVFGLDAPEGWTSEPLKWALMQQMITPDEHP